jgi:hypothetical protein
MHTHTNVVSAASLNWAATSSTTALSSSSLPSIASAASGGAPMRGPTWDRAPETMPLKPESLSSPFWSVVGKESRRRVWPVGAVSNTIVS